MVLACGHFFTAESLDGVVGLGEVYETDKFGNFTGLRDISSIQNQPVPRCPNCKCTIRQFATQRYNRVVNRATMDETAKRFLTNGKSQLQALEVKISELENTLKKSRKEMIALAELSGRDLRTGVLVRRNINVAEAMGHRRHDSGALSAEIETFLKSVSHKNQPVRKLHDATVKAIRASQDLEHQMVQLTINRTSSAPAHNQVVFGARAIQLLVKYITLADMFETANDLTRVLGDDISIAVSGADLIKAANEFFELCEAFITDCNAENFSKFEVEARVSYARAARLYQSYSVSNGLGAANSESSKCIEKAKELLEGAKVLCDAGFQNAYSLSKAVDDMQKLLSKEWYEAVSVEEMASIKNAMVSGRGGFATHSGHWYNCQNGHPVNPHLSDSY